MPSVFHMQTHSRLMSPLLSTLLITPTLQMRNLCISEAKEFHPKEILLAHLLCHWE